MSFYHGTLDKEKAKDAINTSEKLLFYRHGLGYRGAEKHAISKQRAMEIIDTESMLDIDEYENEIILNTYSANDMY